MNHPKLQLLKPFHNSPEKAPPALKTKNHQLTEMVMAIYDASCEWIEPLTVTDPNSVEYNVTLPGRWQFRVDVFRQRLDQVFEAADTARFLDDQRSLRAAAEAMVNAGVPAPAK